MFGSISFVSTNLEIRFPRLSTESRALLTWVVDCWISKSLFVILATTCEIGLSY